MIFQDQVKRDQETSYPASGDEIERLRIASLKGGASPRIDGEVDEHVKLLAEIDAPLPPILVHRRHLRVIDGMHRLLAAQLRGQRTIDVRYFEGTEEEAFVLAVKANTEHGLPLTRADREAAAARIVTSHPHCSDRWLAAITGLAASTVATIRRRSTRAEHRDIPRIGRDGRVRPVSSADARRVASDVITKNPQASLREVARIAGLSPTTVRDVRERMQRGDDPIPPQERRARTRGRRTGARPGGRQPQAGAPRERNSLLDQLRKDPSVRFTDSGRALLRWLEVAAGDKSLRRDLIDAAPPHCLYIIAELASRCGRAWLELAEQLKEQAEDQCATRQSAAP